MTKESRLGRIDDPFDAAGAAYPKGESAPAVGVALRIAGCVPELGFLAGVVNEVRNYLSNKAINERLEALIAAVNEKADQNSKAIADVQSRIDSPQFTSAFREACVQTIFTSEHQKIRRFGQILGGSVAVDNWPEVSDDLTTFIKTIAQLDENDIRALQVLYLVFEDVVKAYPNMQDPNPFTERQQDLIRAMNENKFHPDDFYSHCRRLEGFGLAAEVLRNSGRMSLGDYCFRPTRKGLRLISLLRDSGPTQSR